MGKMEMVAIRTKMTIFMMKKEMKKFDLVEEKQGEY